MDWQVRVEAVFWLLNTIIKLVDLDELGDIKIPSDEDNNITLYFDIKPQSCPNTLNIKSRGVLPTAILGTEDFDVSNIDVSTVTLEGISPIRWGIEDVSAPAAVGQDESECSTEDPDGFDDLTLKFSTPEIVAALGPLNDYRPFVESKYVLLD